MATIPEFVVRDPDVIMSESKAMLEQILGREIQPAQVEQLILNNFVYREVLINNRFNSGMAQMLLPFSGAPILDYLAALVAVERLPAASAGCTVRFTLVEGHGQVLIPSSTRVATSDSKAIFQTLVDMPVASNVNSVNITVQADVAGKGGNGYAPGTVNKILDPLPFVSAVYNLDTTGGGSDVETDEQLRERIKLAPSQYSSAGSRQSYLFYAKSANALIKDVDVPIEPVVPGVVVISVLTDYDETPQQVIDDVYRVCSAENVRPLTDTVIVAGATPVDYYLEVDIVLYENTDAATARAEIIAALEKYTREKHDRLGLDLMRSHITQTCRVASVYDVTVVSPVDNIVINEDEFANCTHIAVNITGFNRG